MKTVNAYLFLDPEPTLIDCGEKTDETWQALLSGLKQQGLSITDLKKIIITHAHMDHMGMTRKVAEASNARVMVSEYAYEWAVNLDNMNGRRWKVISDHLTYLMGDDNSILHQGFAKVFNNFKPYWDPLSKDMVDVFNIGDTLSLGEDEWRVMYAPGHCINQTVFYNETSAQLISADMLLRIASTPVVDAALTAPYDRVSGLSQMINTMELFLNKEISKVYPGHYETFEDGHEKLENQLSRIQLRIEQTYETIKSGNKTFLDILQNIYKNRISGPAIPMMIGYLDVLRDSGRISEEESANGLIYRIV